MDEALSRLMPTHRIGDDGFPWWVGQVELTTDDDKNNKGGLRYKVRIVGDHPGSKDVLPTCFAMGKCDDASYCAIHAR